MTARPNQNKTASPYYGTNQNGKARKPDKTQREFRRDQKRLER